MERILVLGANPAWQKTATCTRLRPGNVVRMQLALAGAAGKGFNCALALRRLGKEPLLISGVGKDAAAWQEACRAEGIAVLGFPLAGLVRQATSLRDLETNEVTELVEEGPPVEEGAQQVVLEALGLEPTAPICCCGSLAPGLDLDGIFSALVTRAGIVVIDSQSLVRVALCAGAVPVKLVLKLNEWEWSNLTGGDLEFSLATARAALPQAFLVATCGAERSWASEPGKANMPIPAPAIPLGVQVHPIGAGDAYTAGLVAGLSDGLGLEQACRRGAAAARASCLDPLPARVSLHEFEQSLRVVSHV